MAASSALTLVKEKQVGDLRVREYTGTADDQTSVVHGGPGKPFAFSIADFLDTEVATAITAVTATNITYGATTSTTAKIFLWFDDYADQDLDSLDEF
jgi:hypothetical protein